MNSGTPWTEAETAALKEYVKNASLSAAGIAYQLSVDFPGSNHSRNSVIGKINRMGLFLSNATERRSGGRKAGGRKVGGTGPSGLHMATKIKTNRDNPRPEPVLVAEPVTDTNVTLADLNEGMCAWPVRDGFYCGGQTGGKRISYCAAHKRQSLDKPRMARYNENYQKSRSVIKRGRTFRGY